MACIISKLLAALVETYPEFKWDASQFGMKNYWREVANEESICNIVVADL
jgi:hypothetical protein